jgi:hypothetical protein
MLVAQAFDPIPPPYAPPADQIEPQPQAADPEPEVVDDARLMPPPMTPRAYLYATYPSLARRLDCMIQGESSWLPWARNGPYLGLAQFDLPTWYSTPQGASGASRTDPIASIDAMAWGVRNLGYARWPVTSRRC